MRRVLCEPAAIATSLPCHNANSGYDQGVHFEIASNLDEASPIDLQAIVPLSAAENLCLTVLVLLTHCLPPLSLSFPLMLILHRDVVSQLFPDEYFQDDL